MLKFFVFAAKIMVRSFPEQDASYLRRARDLEQNLRLSSFGSFPLACSWQLISYPSISKSLFRVAPVPTTNFCGDLTIYNRLLDNLKHRPFLPRGLHLYIGGPYLL